ncbi:MAG TPA: multiheme c-type cytochrome [Blastocatellia bacterium]|nr:multiheme c-type cytochrome [Blastocatellia bacterium]
MGGLARRVSYIKAFKERFKDVAALAVDSGFFLADEQTSHGDIRFDAATKSEWTLRAYEQSSVDVANLSAHDLRFISKWMARPEYALKSQSFSLLRRIISANITADSPDTVALPKYLIREVPFKVAFVGLSEVVARPPLGFRIADPIEAARRVVPEARRQAELVIVLAHLSIAESVRLAREVQGIDVIIAGNSNANEQLFTPPLRIGQTHILFTPYETRTLGELRIYREGEGRFKTRARFISLDGGVPDDPETLRTVEAARVADEEARSSSKKLFADWLSSTAARSSGRIGASGNGPSASVPAVACAACHTEQYSKWAASRHARATDSLVIKQAEFDASCLACHASGTGGKAAGGAGALAQLQNVHCEACHGPGGDHMKNPGKGYGRIADLKASCSVCHTPRTSPGFDPLAAWEKIRH